MRTFETGRTPVEVIVRPVCLVHPWQPVAIRRDTNSCRLILSSAEYADPVLANAVYHRFADQMITEGLIPPYIEFRSMTDRFSKEIFCALSTSQSVFNSACGVGKMQIIRTGTGQHKHICAMKI